MPCSIRFRFSLLCLGILTLGLALDLLAAEPEASPGHGYRTPALDALTPQERRQIRQVVPSLPSDIWVTLQNGFTIILREMPHAPLVSSQIFIKTGSIWEGKDLSGGLTHFLEHIVSGGATRKRTEEQNRDLLRKLGGATNAYTSYDRTVYYIDTTPDKLDLALDLLLSFALESALDPKEVEREKKVIEREILMRENDPEAQLWKLFSETAYLEHPVRYPVIGYLQRFQQVTRDDLVAYYRSRYVPSNMILAVAGDLDAVKTLKQILSLVRERPLFPAQPVYVPDEPPQVTPRRVDAVSPLVRVTRIEVGFPGVRLTDSDLYALDVLAMILGDGRTSRLHQTLKERDQLALSVSASNWTPHFVRGQFIVSISLPEENVERALDKMWLEIQRIQDQGPLPEELLRARKKIRANHVYDQQSPAGIAGVLAESIQSTGNAYFDRIYTERIQAVTAEQVRTASRAYLTRDRVTLAILRPESAPEKKAQKKTPHPEHEEASAIQMLKLKNGLRVLVQTDSTLPMVAIRLHGEGGARYDPTGYAGLSRFTASMLTRGANSMSSSEFARQLEDMGAVLFSGSGPNNYFIQAQGLKPDLQRLLNLVAAALTQPSFSEEEIQKVKQDTLLAIDRQDEDWMHELDLVFRQSQFKEHPFRYDILGTKESVSSFTRKDIEEFHRLITKPNHMVLAILGDAELREVLPLVEIAFGKLEPGELPRLAAHSEEFTIPETRAIRKPNEKTASGIMMVYEGLPLKDPRKPLLDVIDALVSGSGYPGGWLFESLRGGTQSLVYVVHGYPSYYQQGGFFRIVAQAAPKDAERIKSTIRNQINRLARGEFTEGELREAKDVCITTHRISLDSMAARADAAARDEVNGLGFQYGRDYPGLVQMVTKQAVVTLSKKLFAADVVIETAPEEARGTDGKTREAAGTQPRSRVTGQSR